MDFQGSSNTAIFQTNSSQTKILWVKHPGELPLFGGISPLSDKIMIESNPQNNPPRTSAPATSIQPGPPRRPTRASSACRSRAAGPAWTSGEAEGEAPARGARACCRRPRGAPRRGSLHAGTPANIYGAAGANLPRSFRELPPAQFLQHGHGQALAQTCAGASHSAAPTEGALRGI